MTVFDACLRTDDTGDDAFTFSPSGSGDALSDVGATLTDSITRVDADQASGFVLHRK